MMIKYILKELNENKVLEVTLSELNMVSENIGGLHLIEVLYIENGIYNICKKY